jgi:hypothetical protein
VYSVEQAAPSEEASCHSGWRCGCASLMGQQRVKARLQPCARGFLGGREGPERRLLA